MTKSDREQMRELAEKATSIWQEINAIQQDLEAMGRQRDGQKIGKAKDLISEWAEKWI